MIVNEAIRIAENHIAQMQSLIEITRTLPEPPAGHIEINQTDIDIWLPFDMKMYQDYRQQLGAAWVSCSLRNQVSGERWIHLIHAENGADLYVRLDVRHRQSTCTRVKVGEETINLYAVNCG